MSESDSVENNVDKSEVQVPSELYGSAIIRNSKRDAPNQKRQSYDTMKFKNSFEQNKCQNINLRLNQANDQTDQVSFTNAKQTQLEVIHNSNMANFGSIIRHNFNQNDSQNYSQDQSQSLSEQELKADSRLDGKISIHSKDFKERFQAAMLVHSAMLIEQSKQRNF